MARRDPSGCRNHRPADVGALPIRRGRPGLGAFGAVDDQGPEHLRDRSDQRCSGKRLQENVPPTTIGVPLLIGQGEADGLITLRLNVNTSTRSGAPAGRSTTGHSGLATSTWSKPSPR